MAGWRGWGTLRRLRLWTPLPLGQPPGMERIKGPAIDAASSHPHVVARPPPVAEAAIGSRRLFVVVGRAHRPKVRPVEVGATGSAGNDVVDVR